MAETTVISEWSYMADTLRCASTEDLTTCLNAIGTDGWEVIECIPFAAKAATGLTTLGPHQPQIMLFHVVAKRPNGYMRLLMKDGDDGDQDLADTIRQLKENPGFVT